MAAIPNNSRLEPRTAALHQSIWRETGEDVFRQNVVRLAKLCNSVAWITDIVTRTTQPIVSKAVVPDWGIARTSDYRLPLAIESRLSSDLAFIAAAQEGVHSVTAACIEENSSSTSTGLKLTLRLAANGGIPDDVRSALEDIWRTVQMGTGQVGSRSKVLRETVFAKIVRLNSIRMLQRIRNTLGYPPGFLTVRSGLPRNNLQQAIKLIRQQSLTQFGQSFATRLERLELEFCAINANWTPEDVALSCDDTVAKRLQAISEQAFQLTTTGQNGRSVLFCEVLEQAGLDVKVWLENKHLAEVDKLGAYRRVAKSLLQISREISNASATTTVELEIITLLPYRPVQSVISCKALLWKPHVDCFVHAEIQLLCHYILEPPTAERRLPRVIGASKLSCFLCFLCISCYGGLKPPLPHGQIFDQWTIPDLVEFDNQTTAKLRQTIALMDTTVRHLSKKKHFSNNLPLTSRVHIDEVPVSSVEGSRLCSPCPTKISEGSYVTQTDVLISNADRAVSDVVLDASNPPSSSVHSVSGTSSSWSNRQSATISAAAHRWVCSSTSSVEVLVEAEGSCIAQARLEHLTSCEGKTEPIASIMLDKLLPGEDHVLLRKSDQPQMVIDLKLADGAEVYRLSLRWVQSIKEDGCVI